MDERNLHRILQFLHRMMMDEDVQSLLIPRPTVGGDFIDIIAVFTTEHESVQLIADEAGVNDYPNHHNPQDGQQRLHIPFPVEVRLLDHNQ